MVDLPLNGLRVLDLTDGLGELCPRLLADLGADVVRIEPPGGARSRAEGETIAGISAAHLVHNANKRSVTLDLAREADTFWALAATADIVVLRRDDLTSMGFTADTLRERNPSQVVVTISDFGSDGPYADWVATEQVHLALGGVLSRSGLTGETPLLPPGSLATETAATQATWAALAAYMHRLETGLGDSVDVSVYEATAAVFDAGWGIGGSATGGVPAADGPRGRPDARHLYPVFACADGFVRACILSGRQWQGMFTWLGEPEEFSDPQLASLMHRFMAADKIYPAIGRLFAATTREELTQLGHQYGVPVGAVLSVAEVLENEQFVARRAFIDVKADGIGTVRMPNGFCEVDGARAGIRWAAPSAGEHTDEVLEGLVSAPAVALVATNVTSARLPLAGLRVLDLGVIVAGAEVGRLLADLGADVLKLEAKAFPDGARQSLFGDAMTASFAWGHRNKRGVGLNLRDEAGKALFRRLAKASDVVLSNFKPGTLEGLGLGASELLALNPKLIIADSSAFGPTGPYSPRMGYGPLVRATTGLTGLWRYPADPASFSDASTIYPDHVAARICGIAVLAKLVQRRRTGKGGTVSVAQAETILGHLADRLVLESVQPGSTTAVGNSIQGDAPRGVFPCAGDDEWIVVTVRDDADAARLGEVLGQPALAAGSSASSRQIDRKAWDEAVTTWTSSRDPRAAMTQLQAAGVPAGFMQRITDYADDPHLTARGFFRTMLHPLVERELPCESRHAVFSNMPNPELRPAPLAGEHTAEVMAEVLGLEHDELGALFRAGVLEKP